jgi:hypothetical protein
MMAHRQGVDLTEIIQMGMEGDHLIHEELLTGVDHLIHLHQGDQMIAVGDLLGHHHVDLQGVVCLRCSHSVNIKEYSQTLLVMVIVLNMSTLKRK